MGRFYRTDATDPDAPVELAEYHGYRPGDLVVYENPALAFGLTDPMTVTEIWDFTDAFVTCIVNDGEYEINADNLVLASSVPEAETP